LGAVLNAQGDRKAAAASLRRAIALRPDLAGAHYSLSRVLQASGDAAGAKAHLAEAEALRRRVQLEQEARAWTATGSARLDAGDVAGAVDHFRRAVNVFESYAPAHYQLGLALMRLGDRDASRAAFARARALNPSLVPPGDP
jgi:tetratricopeptide (TPR) repeat protein